MSSSVPYHHGDLAAALVREATAMIEERGVSSLSLRELARRAGVSHNAPYHHFGDRHALLRAVAVQGLMELLGRLRAADRGGGGAPGDRLERIGIAYVEFALDHPGAFGAIFDPEVCAADGVPEPLAQAIAANLGLLRGAVQAIAPGLDEPELDALVAAAWSTVHGLAHLVSIGQLPRALVPAALRSLRALGAAD